MRDDRETSIAAEAAAQLAAASADAANDRQKELLESTVERGGTGDVAGSRALNYQRKATPQDHAAAVECFSGIRGAGLGTLASLGLLTDPASQVIIISRIPQIMLSVYEENNVACLTSDLSHTLYEHYRCLGFGLHRVIGLRLTT